MKLYIIKHFKVIFLLCLKVIIKKRAFYYFYHSDFGISYIDLEKIYFQSIYEIINFGRINERTW